MEQIHLIALKYFTLLFLNKWHLEWHQFLSSLVQYNTHTHIIKHQNVKVANIVDMRRQESHCRDNKSFTCIESFQDLLAFEPGPSCVTNEGIAIHPTKPQRDTPPTKRKQNKRK